MIKAVLFDIKAVEILGVDPAEAIYVGDTHVDVQAARAAQMKKVFLYRSSVLGADVYFDSYRDLRRFIARA